MCACVSDGSLIKTLIGLSGPRIGSLRGSSLTRGMKTKIKMAGNSSHVKAGQTDGRALWAGAVVMRRFSRITRG